MQDLKEHVQNLKYKTHITDYKLNRDNSNDSNSNNDQQKVEKQKKMMEKVGNYAKYVKEMYWPKVSESKRNELLLI